VQVCARSKLKQFLFSPPETLLTPAFVGWRVAFGITLRFASPSAMPAGLVFHLLKKAPSVMHAAPCPHPVHSTTANRAALPPMLLPQASRDREEERGSHEGAMGCPACGHSGTLSRMHAGTVGGAMCRTRGSLVFAAARLCGGAAQAVVTPMPACRSGLTRPGGRRGRWWPGCARKPHKDGAWPSWPACAEWMRRRSG